MNRKNQKGQALVEFVILLPIFIFMLFAIIDFGKVLYTKNNLESKMDDVITLYEKAKKMEGIKEQLQLTKENIQLEQEEEQENKIFILKKDIDIITPGLNLLLENPYKAIVKRVIWNE